MHASTNLVAMALLMAGQTGSDATPPPDGYAVVRGAVVSLIDFVQVPARQAGVLDSLHLPDGTKIKEGVEVEASQLLGGLDAKDAHARKRAAEVEYRVAQAEAEKAEVAITAAVKTQAVAEAEVLESKYVNERSPNSVPRTQVRRQELTVDRAKAEATVATRDRETAVLTVEARQAQTDVANINLEMHEIRSPIHGEVVNVYRKIGEWVNPGDPILRIVSLDKLRVEGFVKLSEHRHDEIKGQPVTVTLTVGRGEEEQFHGKISHASSLIQASGDYRVICEIENRKVDGFWVMLPGMEAKMTIQLRKFRVARK